MTMTRPLRLITLHFSQIFFTEGLTFMLVTLPFTQKSVSVSYLVLQVIRPLVRS